VSIYYYTFIYIPTGTRKASGGLRTDVREAHERERAVGIDHYVSESDGAGGWLRAAPETFRVRELERFDTEPVDADRDAYPYLVVRATLRGWDTHDFAAALADGMDASRERVDWAGTKDKHAVTTQLLTVRDADRGDLPRLDDADVEVVGRAGRSMRFGDLAGNDFEVVLTDPERPDQVDAITEELGGFATGGDTPAETIARSDVDAPVGVPNYFGQQRFGSQRPVTHEVGLAAARGDWEGAAMAYLGTPDDAEHDDAREAREWLLETRDYAGALDRFPDRLGYERAMLHTLDERGADGPADFRAALSAVPTNLQRLFVNAAQSYAFNRILSERLRRGVPFDRPVAGDVVCFADRAAPGGLALPDADRLQRVTGDRVETVARHCERGRAFVTAPLVGTDTELGEGEPGEIEREVLDDIDLALGDFALPGEFDSSGTRRAVLVRTDLTIEREPVTFSFALPKGSYATVVLREYLKVDPLAMG
jgi:tRNA pseudouridine13 synthase